MYVLGLHSDGNYFKVCALSKEGKKISIEFLKEYSKEVASLALLKEGLEKKRKFFDAPLQVVSALPQGEVFARKIVVPFTREKEVYKAVEAELSFEDGGEESAFHLTKLERRKKETLAYVYSFSKKSLQDHYDFMEKLELSAEHVTSVEAAFERFGKFCGVGSAPYFHFHLGWESSSLLFFDKGQLVEGSFFSFGYKEVIEAVQKDHLLLEEVEGSGVHDLFLQTLEESKEGAILQIFLKLQHSLTRVREYIERKVEVPEGKKVLFSGYAEFSRLVKGKIAEINAKEFVPQHGSFSPLELSAYAIEIGLALDRIEDGEGVQLSIEQALSPRKKQGRVRRSLQVFARGMAFALLLCGVAYAGIAQKEGALTRRYERAKSLIETYVGKQGLPSNNRKLLSAVQQKEKEDRAKMGPIPFYDLSNWFTSSLTEEAMFDAIEYKARPRGAYVELLFFGSGAKIRANHCKDLLQKQEDFSLTAKAVLEEHEDRVELKVELAL